MLLDVLQSMAAEYPVSFALGVIFMMITEGLVLVGLFRIILKILIRPDSQAR